MHTPRTPPANSALKRRVSSLGGRPNTPDGSPIAGAAAVARAAGFGMDLPSARPRRPSRVSFADSVDIKEREDSSPEKGLDAEDMPPSPCRGQQTDRLSFGIRLSVGSEDVEAVAQLPSSPPDSPGKWRQAWTCLKQRWEDVEMKERELKEEHFDIEQEKEKLSDSRRFLARKMSELEAREYRAAKDRERSLGSTPDRTPSSSRKTTPCSSPGLDPDRLAHAAVQTEEAPPRRRCGFPSFTKVLLLKVLYLIVMFGVSHIPAKTWTSMATWVPFPLEGIVTLESTRASQSQSTSASDGRCEEALTKTRLAYTNLQRQRQQETQGAASAEIVKATVREPSDASQPGAAALEAKKPSPQDARALEPPALTEVQDAPIRSWWLTSILASSATVTLVAIRFAI